MSDMKRVRSTAVKGRRGPLHQRLIALLNAKIDEGVGITQDSLARDVGMHQTTMGGILKFDKGTLDLDEASAALAHIGSSLDEFLRDAPPRELTTSERMARRLVERPALVELVTDLLHVPKTKLGHVIELVRGFAPLAKRTSATQTAGSARGATRARRTKSGLARHR